MNKANIESVNVVEEMELPQPDKVRFRLCHENTFNQ